MNTSAAKTVETRIILWLTHTDSAQSFWDVKKCAFLVSSYAWTGTSPRTFSHRAIAKERTKYVAKKWTTLNIQKSLLFDYLITYIAVKWATCDVYWSCHSQLCCLSALGAVGRWTICSCWILFFHNVGVPVSKLDSCHLSSDTLLIILSSHTVVAVYSLSLSATKGLQH